MPSSLSSPSPLALGFLVRFKPAYVIVGVIPLGLLYVALAAWLFADRHLFVPVALPLFILLPTAFVVAIFLRYRLARVADHAAGAGARRQAPARPDDR